MPCQCKSAIQNRVSAKDIGRIKFLHRLQFKNKARRQRSQRNDSGSQLYHNVSRQSPHRSNNSVEASLSHSELDSMTNIGVFCPPKYCSSKAKTPSQLSTLNQPKPRYRRGRENRRLLLEVRLKKQFLHCQSLVNGACVDDIYPLKIKLRAASTSHRELLESSPGSRYRTRRTLLHSYYTNSKQVCRANPDQPSLDA